MMCWVFCLYCGQVFDCCDIVVQIEEFNFWIMVLENVVFNFDGDVFLEIMDGFVVFVCIVCGGMLKLDVVFFGEYVFQGWFCVVEFFL